MMLFTNLSASLRHIGCDNKCVVSISQYGKYLASHTELWTVSVDCTGIFSIGEKRMKPREKFIAIRNPEKKAKFMACWMLSENKIHTSLVKTWGTLGRMMSVALQTVPYDHLRGSGGRKQLRMGLLFQYICNWKTCIQCILLLFCSE